MHSFQISNNEDLVIESNGQQPLSTLHAVDSEIKIVSLDDDEPEFLSSNPVYESGIINQLKISDVLQPAIINTSIAQGWSANKDKVSEWLWTLHRIGIYLLFLLFMPGLILQQRENFQMEGPTRVMKQLRAIWHILEMTDKEMFAHLGL
ncbi:hypothetical protein HN51_071533 [Arachis hypogaea]